MVTTFEVGALLRSEREARGLTQTDVARRAHTTQSAISRYEIGGVDPTIGTLTRLLRCMGAELVIDVKDAWPMPVGAPTTPPDDELLEAPGA